MNFAKIVGSIGLQVVKAIMTLIIYSNSMGFLSANVTVPFLGDVSGSLVWVALILSLGGILISWLVGIKLPGLEYNNQKSRSSFLEKIVYGEDDRKNMSKHRPFYNYLLVLNSIIINSFYIGLF